MLVCFENVYSEEWINERNQTQSIIIIWNTVCVRDFYDIEYIDDQETPVEL